MDTVIRSLPPADAGRRGRRPADRVGGDLRLLSVGGSVSPTAFVDSPLVAALVGEDTGWRCSLAAWHARRPSRLRFGAHRAWRAEGHSLADKRDRLCLQAADLGIGPTIETLGAVRSWMQPG